ncbi:MAG: hypothetical protein H6727_05395, partial [Myxococcales bacterium]|nr:hypothetical protein [Myxococcales bacterium]
HIPQKSALTEKAYLQQGGLNEWIYLSKPGTLEFETQGKQDTLCFLLNEKGVTIKRDDDGGKKRNCKISQKLPAGLYNISIHIYRNRDGAIQWSRRFIPDITSSKAKRHPMDRLIQEGACSFQVALQPGSYSLQVGDPGSFRIGAVAFHKASASAAERTGIAELFRPMPLPKQAPEESALPTLKTNQPAGFALSLQEKRSFLWEVKTDGLYRIETQGLVRTSCSVRTPAFPQVFHNSQNGPGYNCLTIQYLPAGTYQLQVEAQGSSHGHLRLQAKKLRMYGASRMKVGARYYARLSPYYGRYHNIQLTKGGDHTLQVFSHDDHLFCRLEVKGNWPLMSGKACHWRGVLPKDNYALWIFPTSRNIRYRAMIYKTAKKSNFWPLPDTAYGAQANTYSGNNIADQETPTNNEELRDYEDSTPSRVYRYRRHYRYGRYRRHRRPSSSVLMKRIQRSVLEGLKSVQLQAIPFPEKEDTNKTPELPLYGLYQKTISPLGADAFTLRIPVDMEIQATLSKEFTGRIFAGKRFVAELKDGGGSFRVSAGTYRLAVQHNENKTHVSYQIGMHVQESAPNTWLWRSVPSTVKIRLKERSRLDIKTEGDPDVWCKLSDAKTGKVIQENDNMSYNRWDCRLSELLPAGLYTLEIKGLGKGTWLSLSSRPFGKDHPISFSKTTSLDLNGQDVEGLRFQIKEMVAVQLKTTSRKQLGCALENVKTQEVIGVSGGRRCNLFRLLGPGEYRWRVRSLRGHKHRAFARLNLLPVKPLAPEQTVETASKRRQPAYVLFEAKHNGTYKLAVQGPKTYCGLAPKNGKLFWVNCNQALNLDAGSYLWWVEGTSRQKTTAKVKFEEVPFEPMKRFDLQLKANQVKNIRLSVAKAGFYNIEVQGEGKAAWGCEINQQRNEWPQRRSDLRCQIFTYLPAGQHALHLWRPSEGPADDTLGGSLLIQPLTFRTKPDNTANTEGLVGTSKLAPAQQTVYAMPSMSGIQAQVALHGDGMALLFSGSRIEATCQGSADTATQCRWSLPFSNNASRSVAFVAGKTALYYGLSSHEDASKPLAMSANTTHYWDASKQKTTLRVPLQLPLSNSVIIARGKGLVCQLQLPQGRYVTGCKQKLDLYQGKATFEVLTSHHSGSLSLVRDGQKHQARWGSATPAKVTTNLTKETLGRSFALTGQTTYLGLNTKTPQILRIQAKGQGLVCAMGALGQAAIYSNSGSKGCKMSLPVYAGAYWIGIRSRDGSALQGKVMASLLPQVLVSEGRSGPFLLSQGNELWFGIDLKKKMRVGFGLIAQHEDTRCVVYDNAMKVRNRACMSYETLPAGRYWIKARLKRNAKPSLAHIVIRGLNPPPKTAPASYLRRMMGEQSH